MSKKLEFESIETQRGFSLIKFKDHYGLPCSVQRSSHPIDETIWIGIEDATPQILATHAAANGIETDQTEGWIDYHIPEDVLLSTRMHLTREQVSQLLPILENFANSGAVSVVEGSQAERLAQEVFDHFVVLANRSVDPDSNDPATEDMV